MVNHPGSVLLPSPSITLFVQVFLLSQLENLISTFFLDEGIPCPEARLEMKNETAASIRSIMKV